ncbi:MAG TPA: SAVED domain-containing protein [Candidatus Bathyarchaeia archaeon]|nr:SAVED domain-containing protein [Candidatus Bathyarchaeia archaeon]
MDKNKTRNQKMDTAQRAQSKPKLEQSVVRVQTRHVSHLARLLLFVRAGGRCEFDGCNKYLLEHHVTLSEGNFAQMAHIVAFKDAGPRGREGPRPKNINDVGNLMLLCPECHKLIDDNPADFTLKTLREHKERHESRILHLTGLGPDLKTSILILKANIGKQTVSIPFNQITEAIAPRYPLSRHGTLIDLTAIEVDGKSFLEAAAGTIEQKIARIYEPGSETSQSGHLSVFALAPIPLLIFLGSRLSNKVPVALFQRHRDTENWTWKKSGKTVEYEFKKIRAGARRENVALQLCLSGTITTDDLPRHIDESFSVYELRAKDLTPDPTALRAEADLSSFRIAYQQVLGTIVRDHGLIDAIHMFPAVPAPVAILCGRELLPKVHPSLVVYDYDKTKAGFTLQLRINQL